MQLYVVLTRQYCWFWTWICNQRLFCRDCFTNFNSAFPPYFTGNCIMMWRCAYFINIPFQ